MKTTKLLIGAISIAAAMAAARANSQTLSAKLIDISPALAVNGTVNNGYFLDYPSGLMNFTEFSAFCVEPEQDIAYGETLIYQIQDSSLVSNHDTIARLIGAYLSSSQTAAEAAAVQWAIWETTNETISSPSLVDGSVRISTPVNQSTADLANQYLANVNNFAPVALTYLSNDTRQNVVTWNLVPEPASLGLVAFSGLLLLRRRR